MIPPGGWHFVDKSTGVDVRIEGDSFQSVATALLRFRVDNRKDPGNPGKELSDYICGNWPHFCSNHAGSVKPTSFGTPLSNRVSGWIGQFFTTSRNDAGVAKEEAERRAAVCASCPQNKDFTKGGCGPCIDGIRRLAFVWLRNRKTAHDEKLGACNILNHPNTVAVQANTLPEVTPAQREKLPDNCWRK